MDKSGEWKNINAEKEYELWCDILTRMPTDFTNCFSNRTQTLKLVQALLTRIETLENNIG